MRNIPLLLIFDCDGVLVDSEYISAKVQSAALADHGIAISPDEVARRFSGIPDADMWAELQREHAVRLPDDFSTRFGPMLQLAFEQELHILPGVRDVLDTLKSWSMRFCVASSSQPGKLGATLRQTGLWDDFSPHIFSTAQVAQGKPAPDIFLFAAKEMGFAPEDCMVIEDSQAGVQAARAASMRVVGYVGASHHEPDQAQRLADAGAGVVLHDMRELKDVLRALRGGGVSAAMGISP